MIIIWSGCIFQSPKFLELFGFDSFIRLVHCFIIDLPIRAWLKAFHFYFFFNLVFDITTYLTTIHQTEKMIKNKYKNKNKKKKMSCHWGKPKPFFLIHLINLQISQKVDHLSKKECNNLFLNIINFDSFSMILNHPK